MTQPMTGRASTPRIIGNDPISIFAKEGKKLATAKQAAQAAAPVAPEVTPEAIIAATAPAVTAALAAQPAPAKPAKAAKDPAKVAAAVAKLTQTPLERVQAQQATRVDNAILRHFTNRVSARTAAGQDQATAVREVFAQYAQAVTDALATAAQADAERAYTAAYGEPRGTDAQADQDADSKAAEFTAEQPAN